MALPIFFLKYDAEYWMLFFLILQASPCTALFGDVSPVTIQKEPGDKATRLIW